MVSIYWFVGVLEFLVQVGGYEVWFVVVVVVQVGLVSFVQCVVYVQCCGLVVVDVVVGIELYQYVCWLVYCYCVVQWVGDVVVLYFVLLLQVIVNVQVFQCIVQLQLGVELQQIFGWVGVQQVGGGVGDFDVGVVGIDCLVWQDFVVDVYFLVMCFGIVDVDVG